MNPDFDKERPPPPASPLPIMRWVIYIAIGGMVLGALSYKINTPAPHTHNYSEIQAVQETNNRPESTFNHEKILQITQDFMSVGKYTEATDFLERANKFLPDNAQYLYWLGLSKTQVGDFNGAEVNLLKSLTLSENPNARYALGLLYLNHLDKESEGENHLRLVLTNPESQDELKNKAQILLNN